MNNDTCEKIKGQLRKVFWQFEYINILIKMQVHGDEDSPFGLGAGVR